jgi:hypothetical protein
VRAPFNIAEGERHPIGRCGVCRCVSARRGAAGGAGYWAFGGLFLDGGEKKQLMTKMPEKRL